MAEKITSYELWFNLLSSYRELRGKKAMCRWLHVSKWTFLAPFPGARGRWAQASAGPRGSGRCASPSWVCSTNHPRYRATHKPVPQQRTDSTGNGTHRRKQPLKRLLLKLIRKLFLPLLCRGEPQTQERKTNHTHHPTQKTQPHSSLTKK